MEKNHWQGGFTQKHLSLSDKVDSSYNKQTYKGIDCKIDAFFYG
jgi:hypothetical protein